MITEALEWPKKETLWVKLGLRVDVIANSRGRHPSMLLAYLAEGLSSELRFANAAPASSLIKLPILLCLWASSIPLALSGLESGKLGHLGGLTMADYWPQIITAASTLIGAVTGGFVTFTVQTRAKAIEREENRASLATAIAAEIDAYIDLMEVRKHEKNAMDLIAQNEAGNKLLPSHWMTSQEAGSDPFPILKANLSQIGTLGPVCDSLANFYSQVMGTRMTVLAAREGHYDHVSPSDVAKIMRTELDQWRNAMALGRSTASALRSGTSIVDLTKKRNAW